MATSEEPNLQIAEETGDVFVNLPAGKALADGEASDLLREHVAPIVVLAGAVQSGKTTVLASLHDSFQRGSFAGYLSAGSRTLVGFEERCFDSRAASRADRPSTARTGFAEGQLFYHMKLRDEDLKSPIKDLLLADMSGEHYERALDSAAEMRSLSIIRRADHFVHLVDSGKLASKALAPHTLSNAMMLLRRCFEENMLEPDAKMDILLTKWDVMLARCGQQRSEDALKRYRAAFTTYVGDRIGRVRVTQIAARPYYTSPLPAAYGLGDLLRSWVDEPPRKIDPKLRPLHAAKVATIFDAFAFRETPDLFERSRDD